MAHERLQHFLTPQRRKWLGRLWFLGTVAYDGTRAYIISRALSSHGVNGVYFFIVSVVAAFPYSYTSLKLILGLVDGKMRDVYLYGFCTAILFFVPDLYVFIFAHGLSDKIIFIYGGILVVTSSFTTYGFFREVRKKKKKRLQA